MLGARRSHRRASLFTGVCESDTGCGGTYEFGDADTWQTPRRYEIGFRIEF